MSDTNATFEELIEQLVAVRKRPMLILVMKEINWQSSLIVHETLLGVDCDELDILLNTSGGNIHQAFKITKMLRETAKEISVLVPWFSKSAGTLICLGADKIVLSIISELGPLDAQIKEKDEDGYQSKSALDGFKALDLVQSHNLDTLDFVITLFLRKAGLKFSEILKHAITFTANTCGTLYNSFDLKELGGYRRALELGEKYGKTVLTRYMGMDKKRAGDIVRNLVYNYPEHGYIIDVDELIESGLPAECCTLEEERLFKEIRMKMPLDYIEMVEYTEPVKDDVPVEEESSSAIGGIDEEQ